MRRLALGLVALLAVHGTAEARGGHHTAPAYAEATCDDAHYTNVSGHCVHRPVHAASRPSGASAKCSDGSYSFSEHRRGTCSHHGGVATWY